MKRKISLTVAIPAYNEEANIKNLLISLLKQKTTNFIFEKIKVYTDCGTDKTPEIVKDLSNQYPLIQLIRGKERKGKYSRVNQIFHECKSDVIVVLDADIALVGTHFLEKLAEVMITDPKALLVAAHQKLIQPKGFMARVIYTSFCTWDFVRLSIPNYDSAMNYFGSATAYRGSFARSCTIPSDLSDPHLFIYLMARKDNGFRYCMSAQILQWPITTITDVKRFLKRTLGKRDLKLEKMFGVTTEEVYAVPWIYKIKGFIQAFLWQPFYMPLGLLFSYIMAKKAHTVKADTTPIWDIVTSTKKSIVAPDTEKGK